MIALLLGTLAALALPPEIADAMAARDCDAVLAGIAKPTTDDERLVEGLCLAERGRIGASYKPLSTLEDPDLRPYARLAQARVAAARGDHVVVMMALDTVELPGRDGLEVRLLRGQARVLQGRSLDARDDLRALLDTEVGDEARYWLAVGGRDRGATEAALATFRRTWIDAVHGDVAERAAEALAAMGHPVDALVDPDTRAAADQRVASLAKAHRHDDALALLEAVRAAEGRSQPDDRYATALFRARRYADAVKAWSTIHGAGALADAPSDILFDMALGASRTGDYAQAEVLYERLRRLHPTSREADTASYKVGFLAYDEGRCDAAVQAFETHLERFPASRHAVEARWFAGWCLWRRGDRDAAGPWWDALLASRPPADLAAAVAYWRAREVALDGGDGDAALRAVRRDHSGTAYAWFAAAWLGIDRPIVDTPPVPAWPGTPDDDVRIADRLLGLGLTAEARSRLQRRAEGSLSDDQRLALAARLVAAGDARTAKRLAGSRCRDDDTTWRVACWPRPADRAVARATAAAGLPGVLPYAVMWVESAMAPDAVSPAGARGLMQIMPAEVERLHREIGRAGPAPSPDVLFHPERNVQFGIAELAAGLEARTGQLVPDALPAVIATYNAGPDAVARWLQAAGEGPAEADRFTEDIGYTETRRYTRRVLGWLDGYLTAWRAGL